MRIRTFSAAVATAAALLAITTPVAGASDATAASAPPSVLPSNITFVPPRVGAISVDIAPTIINGVVTDPGLHVLMPGSSVPPMSGTLPAISGSLPAFSGTMPALSWTPRG